MATMPLTSTTPSMSANKFRRQICPYCGSKDIHDAEPEALLNGT